MGEMNTQARSLSRDGRAVMLVDPEKTAAPNERQQTVLIFGLFQRAIEVPKITAASGRAVERLYFIVQCVVRGQQRLALTLLLKLRV